MLKQAVQKKLHEKAQKSYEEELKLQKDSYAAFLRYYETGKLPGKLMEVSGQSGMREAFQGIFCLERPDEGYLLFAEAGGKISAGGLPLIKDFFGEHPETDVVYFHWDEINARGERKNPMFLPEWSPDTLASRFYFGRCFALRKDAYENMSQYFKDPYGMALILTAHRPAALLDAIMYHKDSDIPAGEQLGLMIDGIFSEYDLSGLEEDEKQKRWGRWLDHAGRKAVLREKHKVSILIPSKDHPEILKRCVESIRRFDTARGPEAKEGEAAADLEIIVVDNGSSEENRALYEKYAGEFEYLYEYAPMEFNFSRMCNLAAGKAHGDYLLFLNDDMEATCADWLEKLLEFAALPHIGAVGAKLLYPDTTLIQHAGITNMYEGPAHKLQRHDDGVIYYGGRNRGVWDVIGVTAACLMIAKEKFELIGGFEERLKVAYNDVDLCFRLHKKGFYSVAREDLCLYHHESLSRGNDHLSSEKMTRLAEERKMLYALNPEYYDYDPFYSRHLTGASEVYECCLPYENRNLKQAAKIKELSGKYPDIAPNETLIISVDHAGREQFAKEGEQPGYLIDLHAHVRGLDSCDYRYRMVLKGERGCYEIPAVRRYRPDVEKTIDHEKHVELSGFAAKIPEGILPADRYEIWMEAKCVYSRQRLCNQADNMLIVG